MESKRNDTILVVDDNQVNVSVISKILLKNDYSVVTAYNGREALERVKEKTPALILLDIMMPQMDGYETCRKLKQDPATAEIPVLFISALDETSSVLKGFEAGGVDYVPKPFESRELLARVGTHVKLANISRENRLYAEKMEALASERAKALIHADRLVTLGILSAGVAHEINNPTTAISVSIQTFELLWEEIKALIKVQSDEQNACWGQIDLELIQQLINGIREGVKRVTAITGAMKGYARQSDERLDLCDLHQVIDQGLALCANRLKYDISVEKQFDPGLPPVKINRQKFEQVIINLVINAADAMEDRGRLFIVTTHDQKAVRVEISDTGSGIPPGMIDRIWEPFITTKPPEKGTGLGLSIVKGIIEEYEGTIKAQNNPLGGAQFIITLPVGEK